MTATKMKQLRRRKPGDIAALRRTLWAALTRLEDDLDAPNRAERIKAAHALATLAGTYLRCLEVADLDKRMKQLEDAIAETGRGVEQTGRDIANLAPRQLSA